MEQIERVVQTFWSFNRLSYVAIVFLVNSLTSAVVNTAAVCNVKSFIWLYNRCYSCNEQLHEKPGSLQRHWAQLYRWNQAKPEHKSQKMCGIEHQIQLQKSLSVGRGTYQKKVAKQRQLCDKIDVSSLVSERASYSQISYIAIEYLIM